MQNPYKTAPSIAFWKRAASENWNPASVYTGPTPIIRASEKVASAGSCFAANIVPYLERAGIAYVRTEARHPSLKGLPAENFSYDKFSAAYGNIYTVRHLLQLLRRALGAFKPTEDRWLVDGEVVDAFRPGLRYPALSAEEFDVLTAQHLERTLAAFRQADVFVLTLGLTEAWISVLDGAVFPACPGTVRGVFDPSRHVFHNFSVSEIIADLSDALAILRNLNPAMRIVLTVSPVPLVATATGRHVVAASSYSKSVLRVAAEEVVRRHEGVAYFPSYEIITGPQAPHEFFAANRREVTEIGVEHVMTALLAHCAVSAPNSATTMNQAHIATEEARLLSAAIGAVECEEAAAGL